MPSKPSWAISPFDLDPRDERRRSSSVQLSVDPRTSHSGQMRQICNNLVPEINDIDLENTAANNSSILANRRVHGYSRIMHAHTKKQMDGKDKAYNSVPSYQKTMHAFTLNQLQLRSPTVNVPTDRRRSSETKSETSSPHISAQQAILPSPVCAEMGQLTIDEAPVPPCNSPSHDEEGRSGRIMGRERGIKARSITQPGPRDFAVSAREKVGCGC